MKNIFILLSLVSSFTLFASEKIIFNCKTKNDKIILLKDNEKTIEYSFGKKGKTELLMNLKRSEVKTAQWGGIGRYENYSITFHRNDVEYILFSTTDRNEGKKTSGLNVIKNDKIMAEIECKVVMEDNIEGVNLPLYNN